MSRSPNLAASSMKPGSSAWALATKFSSGPLMLALRLLANMLMSAWPINCLPFCRSSWRTRNKVGRRLTRAAAVPGNGTTPIRLMPRLTQSSMCGFLLSASVTMSPYTSARARILPSTGKAPATVRMRFSVTAPLLMRTSQLSKSLTLSATSAGGIRFTGTTATWRSRGEAAVELFMET